MANNRSFTSSELSLILESGTSINDPVAVEKVLKRHRTEQQQQQQEPITAATLESLSSNIQGLSKQLENIESLAIETTDRVADLDTRMVTLEGRLEEFFQNVRRENTEFRREC